jgi:hypothetical protein
MLSEETLKKLYDAVQVETVGRILNRPEDLSKFDSDTIESCPVMTGKRGIPALHEIHIFLDNLWVGDASSIDMSVVRRYSDVVKTFNQICEGTYENFKLMKDPLLSLKFEKIGYVNVMQSSLYVLSNSREDVVKMTHQIAELFAKAGFNVIREKIEASMHGIDGIPQTDEEAAKYGKYFEYHVSVQRKSGNNTEPLTSAELEGLEKISEKFKIAFNTPVPLSFNMNKENSGKAYHRYLNFRTRGKGAVTSNAELQQILKAIQAETDFSVVKTISEYVWYDTYVGLDSGWIDFEEKESASE